MKKLFSVLLALCLLLSLAVPVLADETTGTTEATTQPTTKPTEPKPATEGMCGDGVKWKVEGTTITISGSGKMFDFEGETPWDHYKDTLTAVKFTGGVTYVGAFAFKDFDKLTSVTFDSKTEELGTSAFQGCDGLTKLAVPFTGKFIMGEDSLRNCKNLKRIDFAGRFPKFKSNCLWDTYATLYYPADNPWPKDTIKELESAFSGRIEFRSSTGEDPVKPTEAPKETEEKKPKPTEGKTPVVVNTNPTETNTAPTWSVTDPTTGATVTLPRPSYTAPKAEEVENEGGFSGWVAIVIVIGVLAAFAAVTIHVQQVQRKNRRKNRRQRPDF